MGTQQPSAGPGIVHTDSDGVRWRFRETSTVVLVDGKPSMANAVYLECIDEPSLRWVIGVDDADTFQQLVAAHGAYALDDLIRFARENVEPMPPTGQSDVPEY